MTKEKFDKKINDFDRRKKLKSHFQDIRCHQHFPEDKIFKKPPSMFRIPPKNRNTVETFIEATNNDIDAEIKKLIRPKHSKLSEREQKVLEELGEKK